MRFTLMAAFVLAGLAAVSPVASSQPDSDISGVYLCVGARPDGAAYAGTVEIVRHQGTYQLLWRLDNEHYLGLGIASDDTLAVTYFGETPGVVHYKIERADDKLMLRGQWTVIGADGQVLRETLTKLGPSSGELHFKVEPVDPAKTPVRGKRSA